jgi:alkylation response protein AidB-like acyl-CoA dehydrogenase
MLAEPASLTQILQRVDALAGEIAGMARRIETTGDIPETLVARLDEEGLFRLLLPPSLRGAALSLPDFVLVIEALAKIDASVAWIIGQTAGCSTVAGYLEPAAAERVFDPRSRGVLAWGPGPAARAVVVPGGYRVTGEFSFASGSHVATWLGGVCTVCERDGNTRLDDDGKPVTRHFLFPREAAPLKNAWQVMGLKGTGSDGYDVEDLFVPDDLVTARHDTSTCRGGSPVNRLSTLAFYGATFGMLALGVGRGMMDEFVGWAAKKTPRGELNSLAVNPLTQFEVGQLEARLRAARSLLVASIDEIWTEIQHTGALTLDQRVTLRMASTFAITEATAVVDGLYLAAGSTALLEEHSFERRFRDMHGVAQQVNGRKAHFQVVGSHLLGALINTTFI